MKPSCIRLVLGALLLAPLYLSAQDTAVPAKKAGVEARLAQALKLFPDADSNKDGKLTMAEAMAYLESNPELREKIFQKAAGGTGTSKPATFSPGEEGTKVFVCAHSFMIYTADMLPVVSKSAKLPYLNAGRQMIGGSRVLQHWNLPDEKNQAKKALKEGIVDVLLLSPHMLLPDEGIDNFTRLGLEKNPELRVLVQSSWAPRDGRDGQFGNEMRDATTAEQIAHMRETHKTGWLKNMEAQVNALNDSVGRRAVFIVPVSDAVYALRERVVQGKAPGITRQSELFRDDLGHATAPIMVLATYCHFTAIHRHSPVGLPVPDSLKNLPQAEELNLLLQQLAWEAVSSYPMSGVSIEAQ